MAVTRVEPSRLVTIAPLKKGGSSSVSLAAREARESVDAVVIKHIHSSASELHETLAEVRALSQIVHPNVARLIEHRPSADGGLELVLEYVHGVSVRDLFAALADRGGRLVPAAAALLVADVCAGLHAAHEALGLDGAPLGLVHRDISPQNVLVGFDGHARVLDFGIARGGHRDQSTTGHVVKGTVEYLSPEQCRRERADRRADLFAAGVILYELATGVRLYHRSTLAQVVKAIVHEPPVPPSRVAPGISPSFDDVALRALAKSPALRFSDARTMGVALAALVGDEAHARSHLRHELATRFGDEDKRVRALLAQHGCNLS